MSFKAQDEFSVFISPQLQGLDFEDYFLFPLKTHFSSLMFALLFWGWGVIFIFIKMNNDIFSHDSGVLCCGKKTV